MTTNSILNGNLSANSELYISLFNFNIQIICFIHRDMRFYKKSKTNFDEGSKKGSLRNTT